VDPVNSNHGPAAEHRSVGNENVEPSQPTAPPEFHVKITVRTRARKAVVHNIFAVSSCATSANLSCSIGRSGKGDMSIRNGKQVSATHGKFVLTTARNGQDRRTTKSLVFIDHSKNGTWHQGLKLEPDVECQLCSGAELKLGHDTTLLVEILC
jgi:FHA domain